MIGYLDRHYPGRTRFIPTDPELALEMHQRDRLYDWYVNVPLGKIVTDRLRRPGRNDPQGVEDAKTLLRTALDLVEQDMARKTWAVGDAFTMADCAAAPSLFYADKIMSFEATHKNATAYLKRLMERPSYARALKEAQPTSR